MVQLLCRVLALLWAALAHAVVLNRPRSTKQAVEYDEKLLWPAPPAHENFMEILQPSEEDTENLCDDGRLLPELYLIGSQKAGTTTFSTDMEGLGIAHAGDWKELHFFDKLWNGSNEHDEDAVRAQRKQWLQRLAPCPGKDAGRRVMADYTPSNLRSVPLPEGTTPTGSHWGLYFLKKKTFVPASGVDWMSWKRLCETYGNETAMEMNANDLLLVRRNPDIPDRMQFAKKWQSLKALELEYDDLAVYNMIAQDVIEIRDNPDIPGQKQYFSKSSELGNTAWMQQRAVRKEELRSGWVNQMNIPKTLAQFYPGSLSKRLTFVVLLREGLSRMQSAWYSASQVDDNDKTLWYQCHDCRASSFQQALNRTLMKATMAQPFYDDWLWTSMYARHVHSWIKFFEPSQFVFIPYKKYVGGFEKVATCKFLTKRLNLRANCENLLLTEKKSENIHNHPTLSSDITDDLQNQYDLVMGPENERLVRLLAKLSRRGSKLVGLEAQKTGDENEVAHWLEVDW